MARTRVFPVSRDGVPTVLPPPGFVPEISDGAAVGLRGSSTIVGLLFDDVAAAGTGFGGSIPITGKVQLEGLVVVSGITVTAGGLHGLQLAVASNVPTTQADLDAGDQLFAHASNVTGSPSTLWVGASVGSLWFPMSTIVVLGGRRFIGGWTNAHAADAADFYVGIVLHRVIGGAAAGDPGFLAGEEVLER